MRKNTIMLLIIGLVLMPLALAQQWPVCFDFQAPDAPTNLVASENVELKWTASSDPPANCSSGIDFYIVYRGDNLLGTTSSTTYKDGPLSPGTYTYKVTAVDKVGNGESEPATVSITVQRKSSGGGGGGGSTSTTAADNWNCGNWSACVNGKQNQTCTHKTMSGVTKTNIQSCTVQVIQQANQTAAQNQTQNQTGPKIIISPPAEEEEKTETPLTQEITPAQPAVEEKTNQTSAEEEKEVSPTGAVINTSLSKLPWALIILGIGLIGAIIITVLLAIKPVKEEKKEKWIEIKVPGEKVDKIAEPTPPKPPTEEKEEEWIELKVPKARARTKAKRAAVKRKAPKKKPAKRKR